jgi:hypothetical protein
MIEKPHLKEHLADMLGDSLSMRVSSELDPEDSTAAEAVTLTDLDVSLAFSDKGMTEAYVSHLADKRFQIVLDEQFMDRFSVLIASLLLIDEQTPNDIRELKIDDSWKERAAALKATLERSLKDDGIVRYWDDLTKVDCKRAYDVCLQSMNSRPLRVKIVKMAVFAGISFLGLHEASHAYGGHILYRKNAIKNMERFDGPEAIALRDDLFLFELLADQAALLPLFPMMISHEGEFAGLAAFTGIEDINSGSAAPVVANYCNGFAAGFGIAVMFFLTDALVSVSPEADYHPPALERMMMIFGSCLSKCVRLLGRKEDEAVTDVIGFSYDKGIFNGARRCLAIWDFLALKRKPQGNLESFLGSKLPCVLCNPVAAKIVERFGSLASAAAAIKSRMDVLVIGDHENKMFPTRLAAFSERYAELSLAREQHIKSLEKI